MSNNFPSKETVQRLREQYPEGTRVELQSMDDPYSKLRPGDRGSVTHIDDTGTVFVNWDKGSGLGLVYGVDSFSKVTERVYETGANFFRDTAVSHGMDEALGICGRYLGTQLRHEQPEDEKQFCRELFGAMFEAGIGKTDPARLVYPYDFPKADERLEASYYHSSRQLNAECARAIDKAINDSCYKVNYYNLELAAMKAVHDYGFQRVNMVLARNFQQRGYDGRFSDSNKKWAGEFSLPEKAFGDAVLNAHPILIEDFAKYARKLYDDVGAENSLLPGRPENGEAVQGYEIVRSISFNDQRGFAIGQNPEAPSPFVCWQFTAENGQRDFYWGHYADDLAGAADNYIARTIVHMGDGQIREVPNHLAAVEMSTEQNYNMIDGLRNNLASPRPDLTDGQTHEEIKELAPGTLPEEKPSVLDQIRSAQKMPKPPRKDKAPEQKKHKGGPEL
jgi:hypothetical protein